MGHGPVSHRASKRGGNLGSQVDLHVSCKHGRRPSVQRAVLSVVLFRALDSGSLFESERPEALERARAIRVKEVPGHEYETQLIPPVVLVAHWRLRISSREVPIEVIEGRVSGQADHE